MMFDERELVENDGPADDHFQMHFLVLKLFYFDSDFAEMCYQEPNYQYLSIASDNGLTLNRRLAII